MVGSVAEEEGEEGRADRMAVLMLVLSVFDCDFKMDFAACLILIMDASRRFHNGEETGSVISAGRPRSLVSE